MKNLDARRDELLAERDEALTEVEMLSKQFSDLNKHALKLEAKLKIATESLEYYADHSSWIAEGIKGLGLQSNRRSIHESDVNYCGGKRAREALEKVK